MAAEKRLHFRIALMNNYTFKDFATNKAGVVRHDTRL